MKMQYRFLSRSMIVLACTVLITSCLSALFGSIYLQTNKIQISSRALLSSVIVLKGDTAVFNNSNFAEFDIKKMINEYDHQSLAFTHNGIKYNISRDENSSVTGDKYTVYTLNPIIEIDKFYKVMIIFIILAFILVYIIATIISQRYNSSKIIKPILKLKEEAQNLKNGDIDTEIALLGESEIKELSLALEELRLKLKESAYLKDKYDDNRKFLISSISHDLKTPVTAIRGYLEGILDGVADTSEKRDKYLNSALGKIDLISTMIEDLTLYSKLDLNQITFDFEKISVSSFLSYIVDDNLMEFERDEKSISFEDLSGGDFLVTVDVNKFRRVVQNIVDNARKNITSDIGSLKIILRETNSSVIIEFKDNGVGIKEDELPFIFDRFFRSDSARKVVGSSGLGLAIAKQIVEGHGGRIWAISEIGKGTSILISLRKAE